MSNLRLIADVHISPLTIAALKLQGYNIVRTTDLLPATAADIEILSLARVENRIVLTQDLDFSMLIALSNDDQPSLITLRLSFAQRKLEQGDAGDGGWRWFGECDHRVLGVEAGDSMRWGKAIAFSAGT